MFKVGDKVKITNPVSTHTGREGVVHEVGEFRVVVNLLPKGGLLLHSFYPYELEKIGE